MSGKKIGYIRISTCEQNSERQLEGLKLDQVFTDTASGKDTNRPQLIALLNYVRDGDTIVIHSMDRLARNLDDLRKLVSNLTARHIIIQFMKESLTFSADESPMSNLLLSVMGAFAEFERKLIRERQLEGIALAKKRGAYKGRKKALNDEQEQELKRLAATGKQKSKIAQEFNISRETVYQYIKQK